MIVAAIDFKLQLAILDNGDAVPIAVMLDINGNETDVRDEYFWAIVPLPCGGWVYCDLRDFEDVKSH